MIKNTVWEEERPRQSPNAGVDLFVTSAPSPPLAAGGDALGTTRVKKRSTRQLTGKRDPRAKPKSIQENLDGKRQLGKTANGLGEMEVGEMSVFKKKRAMVGGLIRTTGGLL